ncbi:5-deoxy-glucuronate isomerase [Paenibacillus sp. GCM10012307]|uniref:5-deoxy-glucuronate isomerase n=1 Tax=Paenibacillus roseus TaxID=2798579 RepID=A0A934J8N0_9BACL|nr:5-deoxy-glucuronate isomerase [Paenibacillus roseus]MBJ6362452.1 5-deoxy-glucuronate isomerase [Paenibacillus roseus]
MAELIVPSSKQPDENGRVLGITPESAGWTYVGFEVFKLEQGQKLVKQTGDREFCAVLLSGRAAVSTNELERVEIGQRMSVFEQIPPYSLYVPPHDEFTIEAATAVEVALCAAPGKGNHKARVIEPAHVGAEKRGHGSTERYIHNILPEQQSADSLLVVEVYTPGGHWSSYPPHKHDQDNLPAESFLEETYYHKIEPAHGFAVQRVYTLDDPEPLDETLVLKDGDAVLVPKGFHPVSAAPGYNLYYLNVMAGPVRTWKFYNDPAHEWLMKAAPVKEE